MLLHWQAAGLPLQHEYKLQVPVEELAPPVRSFDNRSHISPFYKLFNFIIYSDYLKCNYINFVSSTEDNHLSVISLQKYSGSLLDLYCSLFLIAVRMISTRDVFNLNE